MQVLLVGGDVGSGVPSAPGRKSDKKLCHVAVTMLDLRKRGVVHWLGLCGFNGERTFRAAESLCTWIQSQFKNMKADFDMCFPAKSMSGTHKRAWEQAIDFMTRGSCVCIYTPDSPHFDIAMYALKKGMHVFIAKPIVLSCKEHWLIQQEAARQRLICCAEFHKRLDPMYSDAKEQMRDTDTFGHLTYFYAYMSQPKAQLHAFKAWAGREADISFYLNSHHLDFLLWALRDKIEPISVFAMGSQGIANSEKYKCHEETEDSITLTVQFQIRDEPSGHISPTSPTKLSHPSATTVSPTPAHSLPKLAVAVFTACWTAPDSSESHTQQRFHAVGSRAEIRINQAHRGYEITTDQTGYQTRNPLFMRLTPDENGHFSGQGSYAYQTYALWLDACIKRNENRDFCAPSDIATLDQTLSLTAILEAGRRSLDSGRPVKLKRDDEKGFVLSFE